MKKDLVVNRAGYCQQPHDTIHIPVQGSGYDMHHDTEKFQYVPILHLMKGCQNRHICAFFLKIQNRKKSRFSEPLVNLMRICSKRSTSILNLRIYTAALVSTHVLSRSKWLAMSRSGFFASESESESFGFGTNSDTESWSDCSASHQKNKDKQQIVFRMSIIFCVLI